MIKSVKPVETAASDSARYLHIVNDALLSEVHFLEQLVDLPHIADTVDWGERKLQIAEDGRRAGLAVQIGFIVQQRFSDDKHLGAVVKKEPLPVDRWFRWAEALAAGLNTVQALGSVHRDIRPANIVISDGQPVYVDLGEAVFRRVRRPKERPGADSWYTAPEQRGGRIQPSRRADIFSLGAVLFFMARGESPKFLISNDDALKEAVTDALRFEGSILHDNFAVADIISRCLSVDPERRVQSAHELLQDIQVGTSRALKPTYSLEAARASVAKLSARRDDIFLSFAEVEFARFERRLDALEAGTVVIGGSQDAIVRKLSSFIARLRHQGIQHLSVSTPQLWWPKNLGINGRYLSENIELVRHGARVQRLFVLTEEDRLDPVVHDIVRAHIEAEADCLDLIRRKLATGQLETRFVTVPAKVRQEIIRAGERRGLWISQNSMVSVTPTYDSQGIIHSFTFRSIQDNRERQDAQRQFRDEFRKGNALREWAPVVVQN